MPSASRTNSRMVQKTKLTSNQKRKQKAFARFAKLNEAGMSAEKISKAIKISTNTIYAWRKRVDARKTKSAFKRSVLKTTNVKSGVAVTPLNGQTDVEFHNGEKILRARVPTHVLSTVIGDFFRG